MYVPNPPPQPEYWVLSLSGGKDSTALGLEWLKRHQQDPVTYPLHTDGNYNNNNANNSGGVRPGFCDCEVKWSNRNPAFGFQVKDDLRKRRGTSLGSQPLKLPRLGKRDGV